MAHSGDRRRTLARDVAATPPALTACVISYNRAAILATCLRALRFADDVLVIDKSSTDGARAVARALADRVITVPWSPTVEETRAFAVSQCHHDWILLLDDDECLNPAAVDFIRTELAEPRAVAYALPLRHYILGTHDERAYYWPEHHVRLFRRDVVAFGSTVHAGMTLLTDRVYQVPADQGACIHHLSHSDVASWIERTNRYTARPDRARVSYDGLDLMAFAAARIEHWRTRSPASNGDDYLAAVSLLRAVYDIVDRLKTWEEARDLDGATRFRDICRDLDAAHASVPRPMRPRSQRPWSARPWSWSKRLWPQGRSSKRPWSTRPGYWLRRTAAALLSGPPGVVISPRASRRPPG